MRPLVNLAAAAAAVALAAPPARAQLSAALDRASGLPAGLAVPVAGAATAEEPTALSVNPAGVGLVRDLALQYFHEGEVTAGSTADGIWAADSLGPLGVGFSMEWLRPGDGARYRRTRLGLALGDGRSASVGVAWTWVSSPDARLEPVGGWDLGLTWRPWRHLSVGAAMLGRDAAPGVPVRYDLGLATRFWNDAVTLSVDALGDDRARDTLRVDHLAFGAAAETRWGVAVGLGLQVPLRDLPGPAGEVAGLVALSWNGPHSGFTGGGVSTEDQQGWLVGVRASTERYRAAALGEDAPTVDVARELARPRSLLVDLGDPDPYGALVERLEAARDDPDVAALVVKIDGVPLGAARTGELRSLIAGIAARKPVLAYLTGGRTRDYWLATGATAIAAPPGAPIFLNGVVSSQLYLRDALARLGVAFEVVKAGAYKAASEPLVRSEPSPEAREATEALLDDVYGRLVDDVARARRLAPERVRALVDQGLFLAEEARDAGLVDEVLWPDELEKGLRKLRGRGVHATGRYAPTPVRGAQRWGLPPVVEIVRVEGVIASGRSRSPAGTDAIAGAETVVAALDRAARDGRVKAIVLRVESPGGDGLASDLIWRAVARAKRKKPVVASLGDAAASGGYLAAAGAHAIVAEPSTFTGSIGVFALKPDLSGLLAKLAVRREASARGQNAQLTSLLRPWSASERAVLERQIGAFYALFVDRVAEGRKLGRAEVEAVAGGRVWTGRQALERRLVDRLGTLGDAVALAAERAGLEPSDEVEVRRDERRPGVLARVAPRLEATPRPALLALLDEAPELSALAVLGELGPIVALPESWFAAAP